MYNLQDDLGKVKSIKMSNGVEVIATLLSVTEDFINLGEPRVVVINDDELALIPFVFTGSSEEVVVRFSEVQTIVDTLEQSAKDYQNIIEGNQED
tara:strand:+ start:173 stop:457 length:285 start_codon:yes stop_codon:yes gene_type:complete